MTVRKQCTFSSNYSSHLNSDLFRSWCTVQSRLLVVLGGRCAQSPHSLEGKQLTHSRVLCCQAVRFSIQVYSRYIQPLMGLLACNPIVSGGTSVKASTAKALPSRSLPRQGKEGQESRHMTGTAASAPWLWELQGPRKALQPHLPPLKVEPTSQSAV